VVSARPKQWVKNLLVVAAPGAAGVITQRRVLERTVLAALLFVCVSSAVYLLNDVADQEVDRRHPRKQHRPIAAGLVPARLAQGVGVALMALGIGGAALLGWRVLVVMLTYAIVSVTYSLWLKQIAVIELFAVASGFVLRALAGAQAAQVRASVWFLLATSFAALFVVIGKRLSEAMEFGNRVNEQRAMNEVYPTNFLRFALGVAASACIVVYCLWAFDASKRAGQGAELFELSIVPVSAALMRYALLIELGQGGAPEEVLLRDRTPQLLGLVWIALFCVGVYFF
jgi:decaprenyl-phosphate phosphoribosyltransferase